MTAAATSRDNSGTLFATPAIVADRRADGSIIVKSTVPLQPHARCVGDWLEHWARQTPEKIFLGERASVDAPWTTVTYSDALRQVRSTAAWILAQGLSAERPLVILSDNSVDHALFALAAMHAGVPAAAISPAYSLMSRDFDKLKSMIGLLDPGAIYVSGTKPFAAALAAIKPLHTAVIVSGDADGGDAIPFRSIAATPESDAVAKSLRGGRAGYHREIPVHLGLDRHAEGCHQHPAHADLEPAGQGADLVVSRRRGRRSGHSGLAAVEPHLWRQPQFQPRAAQRRHALYRRRQAGAGPVRDRRWPICAA